MNAKSLSIALALVAGVNAQAPETVDATARTLATQAGQTAAKANDAAGAASAQAKAADAKNAAQTEQIDAIDGKLTGLEENFLETKATVDALKKLKISGLVQAQYEFTTDTGLVSKDRPLQQGRFMVRRGRLKATYDAGNGSMYVMQYNLNEAGLKAQDMYVNWSRSILLGDMKTLTFMAQAGLQDIPFGYEVSYSSSTMETIERSRFERNAMFKDEKDVGMIVGLSAALPAIDALGIKFAALNGYGAADATYDPSSYIVRANMGKGFYDLGIAVDLGASYYMDSRKNFDTTSKAYNVIDGSKDYKKSNTLREELDASVLGLDAQLAFDLSMIPGLAGAKVLGEYYTGTAIGGSSNNNRTAYGATLFQRELMGWYVTYVQNIGKHLQTVVRYDVYDPNTSVEGDEIGAINANGTNSADIAYDTWYMGLNVFVNGNTKVTFGYDLVRNETTKNITSAKSASNFSEEIKDDVMTFRTQFAF